MKVKKKQVIYVIINKINNNEYIGSTIDFSRRKRTHLNLLRKGEHHSNYLQNSYNKYGEDNFEFKILEYVGEVNLLIEVEQKWLDSNNPSLNMTNIAGLNSHLGVKRSEETKRKISESLSGRKLSKEHVEAMKKGLTGHKQSEETKKKRSESMKKSEKFQKVVKSEKRNIKIKETRIKNGGYVVTDKMKSQISETLKNKNLQTAISVSVSKYNLNGELINTYPSLSKAEADNNISQGYLGKCLNKGKNLIKGNIWKIT